MNQDSRSSLRRITLIPQSDISSDLFKHSMLLLISINSVNVTLANLLDPINMKSILLKGPLSKTLNLILLKLYRVIVIFHGSFHTINGDVVVNFQQNEFIRNYV